MIQRVQTLYMLLASVLVGLMLIFPLIGFSEGESSIFELRTFGFHYENDVEAPEGVYLQPTTYMGVINIMASLLPLILIFLYKNRILQIRLSYVSIVLMFGLQIFVGYYIYKLKWSIDEAAMNAITVSAIRYSIVSALPIFGVILMWLSIRGIIKDESLVRSLDRIR